MCIACGESCVQRLKNVTGFILCNSVTGVELRLMENSCDIRSAIAKVAALLDEESALCACLH